MLIVLIVLIVELSKLIADHDDLTCFMASIEFPCRCAYELHTPADVCWCADVC